MIPNEIKLEIIDFIDNAERIPDLECAILFGSAIKNELHKKSDIDLLLIFNAKGNPEIGEHSLIVHQIAAEIEQKRESDYSFSFVIMNKNDEKVDSDFLWNVAKEGIIIWGFPEYKLFTIQRKDMTPRALFHYNLSGLVAREKKAVRRAFFGYRTVKNVLFQPFFASLDG